MKITSTLHRFLLYTGIAMMMLTIILASTLQKTETSHIHECFNKYLNYGESITISPYNYSILTENTVYNITINISNKMNTPFTVITYISPNISSYTTTNNSYRIFINKSRHFFIYIKTLDKADLYICLDSLLLKQSNYLTLITIITWTAGFTIIITYAIYYTIHRYKRTIQRSQTSSKIS